MRALFTLLLLATSSLGQAADDLDQEYQSQSGTAIHIVFDDSGSMKGTKMNEAKEAFTTWLARIPEETKLSLTALNAGPIIATAANNRAAVADAVAKLNASGGTPLGRTCAFVKDQTLTRRESIPYERHIIVVFTDGEDSEMSPQAVGEVMRSISAASIETVGIGFHGQGDYLQESTGQYFNASDAKELAAALSQVGSEIDSQSELVISSAIAARMENTTSTAQPTQKPPQKKGFFEWLFGS